MKKNQSNAESSLHTLHTKPLLSVQGSQLINQNKKIEGFDRTAPTTSNFSTKIEKIKNKPKK